MEPEIVDLQNFLNKMGAKIYGAGTNIIRIKGVKTLKEISKEIFEGKFLLDDSCKVLDYEIRFL